MKPFTKNEVVGILIIFGLLILISVPNFWLSLRRARDQVRRDDLGALVSALDNYLDVYKELPLSSYDSKILACKKPEDKVKIDKNGRLVVNLIPCEWGKDSLVDLTPGSKIVFMQLLPRDPDYQKGVKYLYFSDGDRYQIYASFEGGSDEAGYDPNIDSLSLMCGTKRCNVGRSYNVPINISIEEYNAKQSRNSNVKIQK